MNTNFKFKTLTAALFCAFLFFGSYTSEVTPSGFPSYKILMLLTFFIFIFNAQQVLAVCQKNKLLITLLFYSLLSAIWANSPMNIVRHFIFLLSILFISIMTALAFPENKATQIRWMFGLFLMLTLASIMTAIYLPKVGIMPMIGGVSRWKGITPHPNTLGAQLLLLIWLSANLFFLSKSRIEKSIILFAIVAAFYALLKADSMTSFITSLAIIGLTCYYYLFTRITISTKLILYTLTALSFLVIFTFYMSATELAETSLASTGRNTTFTGRSIIWQTALKYASDHIILGYGFDGLEQLTKKTHIEMSHLHNGYIEILLQGGLIASILLGFILIKTLLHQLRIKSTHKHEFIFLNTGLVMILVHNITESSILRGLNPLNIFLIFIIVSTSMITTKSVYETSVTNK